MKDYVDLLKRSGAALQEVRDKELRQMTDVAAVIEALQGPFCHAILNQELSTDSGLTELQRYLAMMKRTS